MLMGHTSKGDEGVDMLVDGEYGGNCAHADNKGANFEAWIGHA